jgi:hypothetical protein
MADSHPSHSTGVSQFCFLVGATLALLAAGATLLTVSPPEGLKLVIAALAGSLALACAGLAALAQALDRSS